MLAHAACVHGVPRPAAVHCTGRADDDFDRPTAHLALPHSRPHNGVGEILSTDPIGTRGRNGL